MANTSGKIVLHTPTALKKDDRMQTATQGVKIVPLVENTERIAELERWFVAEWEPHYGHGGTGNALNDLNACCNRDGLPIALVAIDADGSLLGTAALKSDSVGSRPGQSPWLAAFIVNPQHRRRGIGTLLVAAIEDEARRLGFKTLYISTDAAKGLVERRGWSPLETVASLRGPITVYKLDIVP